MQNRLYDQFLWHHRYMEPEVDHFEETDTGELLIYLKNGSRVLYDSFEDRCRDLPKDGRSLTEAECNEEFAARLRSVMRRKGCTQPELAKRTGFSQSAISKYVTGKTMPSFYSVDRIARALNCSIDELRYRE